MSHEFLWYIEVANSTIASRIDARLTAGYRLAHSCASSW